MFGYTCRHHPGELLCDMCATDSEHALIAGLSLGSDLTRALQSNGGFVHPENSHGSESGEGLNLEYLW